MTRLIPEGFTFATEPSSADWIVERLKPWGRDRVRLWSFLPDAFDRYARVLHPFHGKGSDWVSWKEVAAQSGVVLHPTVSFRELVGDDVAVDTSRWKVEPSDGYFPQHQVEKLSQVLVQHTGTPQRCWLAVWVGWGSWRPGSRSSLVAVPAGTSPPEVTGEELPQPPDDAVVVKTQHREYFLLSSGLALVPSFEIMGWHQSPSIWWPEDRAWCVITEVDGYSTYVGGTASCVDAVIASSDLEAIEVTADVPMDPGPY